MYVFSKQMYCLNICLSWLAAATTPLFIKNCRGSFLQKPRSRTGKT